MTRTLLTLAALLGLTVATTAVAADPPKIEGDWEGVLQVTPDVSLRIVFHVKKADDGKLSATMDSPDQGANGLRVDDVSHEKDAVTLTMKAIQGEYRGKIAADGSKIDGEFTQAGKLLPLALARMKGKPAPAARPDQIWEGTLKVNGGIELRIVLNLFKEKNGFRATMDSPDQGVKGLKVDSVSLDKKAMAFEVKLIKGKYAGKLNDAGDEADGEWTQLGNGMPLKLKKTDKVTETKRTQMPKGPFPYREIQVAYPNKAAGNTLAGTLTLPEGDGPFTVVVLISGSGAQDRDETLLGHKPFLVLADDLTRRGVGVLRFDDRGVGGSTGDHGAATSADFATDVRAGIDYLKTRKDVNAKKIGLMGHSEGGLIAPMVAAQSPEDVAFLVLLAGPGVPGDEILMAQSALILKAMGVKDSVIERSTASSKKIFEAIRREKDEAALTKAIAAIAKEAFEALTEDERKAVGTGEQAEARLKMIRTPWFRFFLTYDPRPTLAKVKCPVMAVNGEKDLQVPPGQNLPEIAKALKSGGNDKVTIRELPGLNHLFQASKTGAPGEYARIEETINPEALKVIGDWIVAQ